MAICQAPARSPGRGPPTRAIARGFAAAAIVLAVPAAVPGAQTRPGADAAPVVRWDVAAPDAALAWFALLAELRLGGAGAFPFVASAPGPAHPVARTLAGSRDFEILHFVPLYHPSADRAGLVAALRAAASTPPRAPTPRAEFVVGALAQAIPAAARQSRLPELAAALERQPAPPLPPAVVAAWQRELDSLYLPALAPWLRAERLDAGRLLVSPALGAEGRIFAGTADRADNLVAVGSFPGDPDASAPLHAFVRETCFPAVTRATRGVRGFAPGDAEGARRASLAAVRCGAELLDALLPARAAAYRAFWMRRAAFAPAGAEFDAVFPPDPALRRALAASLRRVAPARY